MTVLLWLLKGKVLKDFRDILLHVEAGAVPMF